MASQNLPISGLYPLTGALTSNDLMVISQEQPEGWQSFNVEVSKFVDLVISGMNDGSVFLRKVHTIESSGLVGSGTIPDALGLDWDYLRTQFAPNDVGNAYVAATTKVIAGNGLAGGGALNVDRTITLGVPSTVTATSTNEVNGETHSHAVSLASTNIAGLVKLNDTVVSDSVTEATTARVAKSLSTGKTDKTTTVAAGPGLTGGGDLSTNRVISLGVPSTITDVSANASTVDSHTHNINKASTTVVGIVKLDDAVDSSSSSTAATSRAVKTLNDGKADKTTAITAGAGLTGGGNLTASRTIAIDYSVLDTRYALTGVGGSYVPLTRNIATGPGLSGGGALNANLTLAINFGTAVNTVAMGNDARINNGQTAYGWGNHGSQNYLKLVTVSPTGALSGNGTTVTPLSIDFSKLDTKYLSTNGGTINGDLTVTGAVNIPGLETGVPLGTVMWFNCPRSALPDGWVASDGQLGGRADFPDLWNMINTGKLNKVSDGNWNIPAVGAASNYRSSYSTGTTAANFRFPDLNGRSSLSLKSPVLRGDGYLSSTDGGGVMLGDTIRNITGNFTADSGYSVSANGAFSIASRYSVSQRAGGDDDWGKAYTFDASRTVPTSDENRPVSAFGVYAIKARGGTSTIPAQGSPATLLANQFNGSQKITGDLEVTGNVTFGSGGLKGLGIGQTYKDLSTQRLANVVYTNTTPNPIWFMTALTYTDFLGYGGGCDVFVSGVKVLDMVKNPWVLTCPFIIPPGQTYKIVPRTEGAYTLTWIELS